jgi:hypothetical protein
MPTSVLDTDLVVRGVLRATSVGLPATCVGDTQMNASDPVGSDKLQHQYIEPFAQAHGVAAVSERRAIHVARGAGTLTAFRAGLTVANVGAATVTVDLRRNGTTILTSVITLNSGTAAFAKVDGVISSATVAAGDVFEVVTVATAGGGTLGQGVFATLIIREAAD